MPVTVACSLIKTTLVDYPARVAAACFVSGCNLRCPYCYNAELVRVQETGNRDSLTPDTVSFDGIINHLQKRRNVLTGFVISGGEPLLHYDFTAELIRAARALGYKIKLDTNGTFPERLETLINDRALRPDYIALDLKTSPQRYDELLPQKKDSSTSVGMTNANLPTSYFLLPTINKSIELLSSLPPHAREFRTVLYPPLVGRQEIAAIAGVLPKDAAWYFAQFRNEHCLSKEAEKIPPYTDDEIKDLVEYAGTLVSGAKLR